MATVCKRVNIYKLISVSHFVSFPKANTNNVAKDLQKLNQKNRNDVLAFLVHGHFKAKNSYSISFSYKKENKAQDFQRKQFETNVFTLTDGLLFHFLQE